VAFKEIIREGSHAIGVTVSEIVEVPDSELEQARLEYVKTGTCTHEFVQDKDCWPYTLRDCAVCGMGLGAL